MYVFAVLKLILCFCAEDGFTSCFRARVDYPLVVTMEEVGTYSPKSKIICIPFVPRCG